MQDMFNIKITFMKKVINIWAKTITFIMVLFVLIFTILNTELFQSLRSGDLDTILLTLNEKPAASHLITFVIMLIQNAFTIIPLILIITINYSLYGFFYGLLWSWITSIIAAAFWFYGSRYLFHDWVKKKAKQEILMKMEKNGLLFVFQARIFPFVPTSIINILGGVSSIQFKHFILGTMLGNFIFFLVLSFIPAGLMSGNMDSYILVAITIILLVVAVIYRKKKKSKRISNGS